MVPEPRVVGGWGRAELLPLPLCRLLVEKLIVAAGCGVRKLNHKPVVY